LYRPHDVTRLAGLLHGGKVGGEKCNRVFQPHDAHIPHHLQFMCDYNLAGMGIITGESHPVSYSCEPALTLCLSK
jgi:DNA polymerase zeta